MKLRTRHALLVVALAGAILSGGCGYVNTDFCIPSVAQTAKHEAGHAAVAREFGWEILTVQVDSAWSGLTVTQPSNSPELNTELITLKIAGPIAAGSDCGSGPDYARIDELLAEFPPGERDAIRNEAHGNASRIVAARSAEIDRDAEILLAVGSLN